MKFRVVRNEPLEKSINKANLVLVEVPVNTKHGQHRAHRWKRAIEALDQLFKDLGKKANAKDITFIDKKTNKKVNKDELIENYEKKGKQNNETLQAFVADNYKVSTKKDDKEIKAVEAKDINAMSSKDFADYVYKNGDIEGTEDGLYIKLDGKDIEVRFNNDDINEYLGTDLEGEELLEAYENREDEIDKHFIEEQRDDILEQLSDEEETQDDTSEESEYKTGDEFADYIYNNADVEGTEDGLLLKINGKEATVNFGNDEINEYLGTNLEGEELLNAYEEREDEIDKHFIKEQRQEIEEQLSESVEYADYDKNNSINNDKLSKEALVNKETFESIIEAYKEEYNKNKNTNYPEKYLEEFKKGIKILEKIKNRDDNYFWECNNFKNIAQLGPQEIVEMCSLQPKLNRSAELTESDLKEAYSRRHFFVMDYEIEASETYGKGKYSKEESKLTRRCLRGVTDPKFYLKTKDPLSSDYRFSDFVEYCKEYDDDVDYVFGLDKKRFNAYLRFGTKKISSKNEYKVAKSFDNFKSNLENLKDFHTDTLARAAMDMVGIDAPLYVKRNGKNFKSGKNEMLGYCRYNDTGQVKEIGVVDRPDNRKGSYKTTIHEVMHGLLAKTKTINGSIATKLPKRFNEGIVEMVGYTSTKLAYGKEYKKGSDVRSYPIDVLNTFLRLEQMPEYQNKKLTQIGQSLGNMAFNRDSIGLNRICNYLTESHKKIEFSELIKKHKSFTLENIEKVAKTRHESSGASSKFEETQMAMLIDRIKQGDLTLDDALKTNRYGALAAILLYNILDEEDDEILGLL